MTRDEVEEKCLGLLEPVTGKDRASQPCGNDLEH